MLSIPACIVFDFDLSCNLAGWLNFDNANSLYPFVSGLLLSEFYTIFCFGFEMGSNSTFDFVLEGSFFYDFICISVLFNELSFYFFRGVKFFFGFDFDF